MAKEAKPFTKVPRYRLEKYSGKNSRHTCPSCGHKNVFSRFIDVTTGEYVADDVGRCNREERCGFQKSPSAADGKEFYVTTKKVKKAYVEDEITHLINPKFVVKSMGSGMDNFTSYLMKHFDHDVVRDILRRYRVGIDNLWENSTVFWQIDQNWDVRTGKIMLYDENTGKRVKQPYNHISWVHVPDKNNKFGNTHDFSLTQCFFGEHLLNIDEITTFGVVESEKTAILCSIANPDSYWIATGGVQNINEERLLPFKDKKLVFYPDKGKAFKVWEDKIAPFKGDYDVSMSNSVENSKELKEGEDIGDLVIYKFAKK
ncbi:MAG: DUF6371 domain-containing protein [Sphaerochaetaceae bacterium]|nr:DUF6371 domain-containing protein [Sphaerochaetaceae bacterium]